MTVEQGAHSAGEQAPQRVPRVVAEPFPPRPQDLLDVQLEAVGAVDEDAAGPAAMHGLGCPESVRLVDVKHVVRSAPGCCKGRRLVGLRQLEQQKKIAVADAVREVAGPYGIDLVAE